MIKIQIQILGHTICAMRSFGSVVPPLSLPVLICQIHISYSYFLLSGKGYLDPVLFIFLLLSVFALCINLHLHLSINSSLQLAHVLTLLLPSCFYDGVSVVPGAHRYRSGYIRVYEACDGMHHHCIYSIMCVGALALT